MASYIAIEKLPGKSHYTGYAHGVWRITQTNTGRHSTWRAYHVDGKLESFTTRTLAEMDAKLVELGKPKKYEYLSGTYGLCVELTREEFESGHHSGACDDDIAELRKLPHIASQLDALDRETLAKELKEYGAWDATELADHDANLSRFLWLACGDLSDNNVED